jgi:hypothetical protein
VFACSPLADPQSSNCNKLDFMMGAILYSSLQGEADLLEFLSSVPSPRHKTISEASYAAHVETLFTLIDGGSSFDASPFDFCALSNGRSCTVATFNVADDNKDVSDYRFRVEYPACNNSFKTSSW